MKLLSLISVGIFSLAACFSKQDENPIPVPATAVSVKIDGEKLFKINCSQCHKPAEDFTAPSLAGVEKRWKSKALLYDFIKNSEDVIQRNAYAMALYKKWNQAYMQPFSNLSNADIDAILKYCNAKKAG